MLNDDDVIIIRQYRNKVSYYGLPPVRAWVFAAAPVVAFAIGLLVGRYA